MDPHSDDFARFGIDPDDADAERRLDLALLLTERGASAESIAQEATLARLNRRIWASIFVGTDDLVPLSTAAAATGVDLDVLEETVRLLGLPVSDDAPIALDDINTLRTFTEITAVFGEDSARQIARTIGSSMARLAETITSMTRVGVETPMLQEAAYTDFVRTVAPLVSEYFPVSRS
jgi:hypothetical protein